MEVKPKIVEIQKIKHVFSNEAYFSNNRSHHKIKINRIAPISEENPGIEDITSFKNVNFLKKPEHSRDSHDSLQKAFGQILTLGQLFGLLPVVGVLGSDPSHLRFSWCTWRVGYTFTCIAAVSVMISFCLFRLFSNNMDIYKTMSTTFFMNSLFALFLFLRLAKHWPDLMLAMSEREQSTFLVKKSLCARFKVYTFAILAPALIEHALSLVSGVAVAIDCSDSVTNFYFIVAFPQIFSYIDYAPWKGAIAQTINVVCTFIWNYTDLFVILISVALIDRFEQLNEKLKNVRHKNLSEYFWKTAREEYVHLSYLVKKTDEHLNPIILLSFANNVYFICVQLFNSFRAIARTGCVCSILRKAMHVIYFIFSFGLLVSRWLAVSLTGAKIYSSSRYPATVIYSAPSNSYGIEQSRFLEQVNSDMIALTGLNFFYLTRGLVLTIAGTIVTYELVLVQMNVSPTEKDSNITSDDICI